MVGMTTSSARSLSEPIQAALKLPDGARFYRCALQVNPYAYLDTYGKQTPFQSESDYNKAMVEACVANGIEVIGVTDHYRVQDSWSLVRAARDAGLWAFGGCEAVTKDGVHFLCLFDPERDEDVERFIGSCGIRNSDQVSPVGSLDSTELLDQSRRWGAVCIASHVASKGGLLTKLSGQSRGQCVEIARFARLRAGRGLLTAYRKGSNRYCRTRMLSTNAYVPWRYSMRRMSTIPQT